MRLARGNIMNFQPETVNRENDIYNNYDKGFWFIFRKADLLDSGESGEYELPLISSPEELGISTVSSIYLGKLDGKNLWACEASGKDEAGNSGKTGHRYRNIREFFPDMNNEMISLALRALHLKNWNMNWKFCPSCGGELKLSETERAKICKSCSGIHYPVMSPAIIVAVRKGNKLLLANNKKFPNRSRYSILAGFVEAGESLEETVHREVFEEVGIAVKNIKYFGSQNWPFPHSLMIGFTAEHDSGEIKEDNVEIAHADWYGVNDMPAIPPFGSISRLLIEDFKKNCG